MIEQSDVQALVTRTKSGAVVCQTRESGDFQAEDGVRYVLVEKRALWRVWPHLGGLENTMESCVADLADVVAKAAVPYAPPPDAPRSTTRPRTRARRLQAVMPQVEQAAKRGRVTQEALQLEM